MGQRAGTGASRVRLLLTRALLTLGGAAAGTAAAWALSTASAAADELPALPAPAPVTAPVTAPVAASAGSVTAPVTAPVTQVATPVDSGAHDVATRLDSAVRAEQRAAHRYAPPAPTDLPVLADVTGQLRTALGTLAAPAATLPVDLAAPLAHTPAAPSADVSGQVRDAERVAAEQSARVVAGLSRAVQRLFQAVPTGHPGPEHGGPGHTLPERPAEPAPFPLTPGAPVGVPGSCACGHDGAGSTGGQFAATAAQRTTGDPTVSKAATPADTRVAVTPGRQPGITPD